MRQDARANAAISILDNFLLGQNLNSVLSIWAKNNRYAGSSDREAIRNIVFDVLRVKKTLTFVLEKEKQPINGRALVFLHSVFYALNLNDIFTGQKYGPEKLSIFEKEFSKISKENRHGNEGMGLGLFIAKTLLERTGAKIRFANGNKNQILKKSQTEPNGAIVEIYWPRKKIESASNIFGENQNFSV